MSVRVRFLKIVLRKMAFEIDQRATGHLLITIS